jgi:2-keto-4-pentenoate hydratase
VEQRAAVGQVAVLEGASTLGAATGVPADAPSDLQLQWQYYVEAKQRNDARRAEVEAGAAQAEAAAAAAAAVAVAAVEAGTRKRAGADVATGSSNLWYGTDADDETLAGARLTPAAFKRRWFCRRAVG